MAADDLPTPTSGFVLTHFIVAADVARSRDFYAGVLGGEVVMKGEPTILKLANSWVTVTSAVDQPTTSPQSCSNHPETSTSPTRP
jgi:hypothetical protein